MTRQQIKDFLEKAEAITKEAVSSVKKARELLIKGGILTKRGTLRKEYRQ